MRRIERQRQRRARLGLIDVQELLLPVDRVEAQSDDLARAQPVVGDQMQDAEVAPVRCGSCGRSIAAACSTLGQGSARGGSSPR